MQQQHNRMYLKMAARECGCSGIRTCLICENNLTLNSESNKKLNASLQNPYLNEPDVYHFCLACKRIISGEWKNCPNFCFFSRKMSKSAGPIGSAGLYENTAYPVDDDAQTTNQDESGLLPDLDTRDIAVMEDFITEEEESFIKSEIYKLPWKLSQSGRRKQDFGPQANFKKKKLKVGNFTGLPFFLRDIVSKMNSSRELADFMPVEVCHLEYCSKRGSSIDPHIDDTWLWGERLVTLNLLSSSILTLSNDSNSRMVFQIPMPRKSLLVLQGKARYIWKHAIERRNIDDIRLAVTFRELSGEFISGSQLETGAKIIEIARNFNGKPIYSK